MRLGLPGAAAALVLAWAAGAMACSGPAGRDVAIAFDGQKYTVTDTGRAWLQVALTAFGTTYNLQLAPGQSETPRSPGMFTQPMAGLQSCIATPIPAASPAAASRSGR